MLKDDGFSNLKYQMEFEQLDDCTKDAKMLLLCSPDKSVGRVWKKVELLTLLTIAKKLALTILFDEIHATPNLKSVGHGILSILIICGSAPNDHEIFS